MVLASFAPLLSLPHYLGHSMRAGGATALTCAGFAPALIQSAGCWSSTAFEGYIRQHPFILHAIMQPGGMRQGPHHH